MKKALFPILAMAALGSASLSAGDCESKAIKSGFYGGGHIGGTFMRGRFSGTHSNTGFAGFQEVDRNFPKTASGDSFMGGVFVGGRKQLKQYIFGIEAGVDFAKSDANHKFLDRRFGAPGLLLINNLEKKADFQLSAIFGYLLTKNFLIYGKLGVSFAKFSYDYRDNTVNLNQRTTGSKNKTLAGFMPGLGCELAFNNWLSGRVEFVYSHYRSFNVSYSVRQSPLDVQSWKASISPRSHSVRAGFVIRK